MAFPRPSLIRVFARLLLVVIGVPLTGCDQGPSNRVIETRISELETKLKLIEKRADSAMLAAETSGQDLVNRIEAAEQQGTEAANQTATLVTENEARFQRLEQGLANVMRIKEESEAVAYLDPTSQAHRPIQTDHGTFLVRLESIQRNPLGGFVVELNIGNSLGMEIMEYRLKGDFGQPAPKLEPGEAYGEFSKRLDEWQKTLTPFEVDLNEPILPDAWSRVLLPLNAPDENALKLIRLSMSVGKARLDNQEGPASDFSAINADSKTAGLVKTDYGPLLVSVTRMEPEGSGTRVHVMVGNPYGFIINEGVLSGQFGPSPPRKMESEAPPLFQKRLQIWSEQMEDFTTPFSGAIAPLRWSDASFLIPSGDQTRIKYLRVKLQVTNITLPRTGPPTL